MAAAVLCAAVALCFIAPPAPAQTLMNLYAKVSYSIENALGPLPDGSIVYIVGSLDDVVNPMQSFGTNYIAKSTTGDDVILGTVRIGQGVPSNSGRFIWSGIVQRFTNVYIRYFDSTNEPVSGYTNWGESTMKTVSFLPLGGALVDFAPSTNLYATNQDNFVVIPEPGTLSLMGVGLFCIFWRRRRARREAAGE